MIYLPRLKQEGSFENLYLCVSEGTPQDWSGREWVSDGLFEESVWRETEEPSAHTDWRQQTGSFSHWSATLQALFTPFMSYISITHYTCKYLTLSFTKILAFCPCLAFSLNLNMECENVAPAPLEAQQQSSSRQRLEQFKTRAKRSLTESLEGIWKVTIDDILINSTMSQHILCYIPINCCLWSNKDGILASIFTIFVTPYILKIEWGVMW